MSSLKEVVEALNGVVDAWEALPGGRSYALRDIETWLRANLRPAIDQARRALGRKRPDGTDP